MPLDHGRQLRFLRIKVLVQITQEKIARMAGNIQAMWLMAWRLSRLHEQVHICNPPEHLNKSC